MAVNENDLKFLSSWDIDQLVKSATVSISGSGNTSLINFSSLSLPTVPVFAVQFQPSGSSQWFSEGLNSTDGTFVNLFTFYSYVDGTTLYINTASAGTARYFLWHNEVVA